MARTLTLIGDMDGCALWRCLLPITELQRQGYPGVEWGRRDDDRLAMIAHKFDAIILPRLHWPVGERAKSERWFRALRRAGLSIIYEVDDDLFSDDFVRRIMWREQYTLKAAEERRDCILSAMQACDGVTVSGQRLATMARLHTDRPVVVVPNYIDLRWFHKIQKSAARVVPGLTIGWAGGARPDVDVEIMAEAWERIARRYPFVTFVVQGHHAQPIFNRLPPGRLASLDWMPIETYPAGLVNIDIGCCPLADTKFNRAKTHIKALEYAASGAAVVASPTVYDRIIDDGVNGYIAGSVEDWEQALAALVEDYRLRRSMSRALLAKVRREHALEANAWRWPAAWDEIIASPRIMTPSEVQYAI